MRINRQRGDLVMNAHAEYHLVYEEVTTSWVLHCPGSESWPENYGSRSKKRLLEMAASHLEGTGSSLHVHQENGQLEEVRIFPLLPEGAAPAGSGEPP